MNRRNPGQLRAAILLSVACNSVWAQNHVDNPSFETPILAPGNFVGTGSFPSALTGWYDVSWFFGYVWHPTNGISPPDGDNVLYLGKRLAVEIASADDGQIMFDNLALTHDNPEPPEREVIVFGNGIVELTIDEATGSTHGLSRLMAVTGTAWLISIGWSMRKRSQVRS